MERKNLLILTSTFPQGADDAVTARFVYDLAKGMTAYLNIFVLCPMGRNAKSFEEMDGVKVHRFRYFLPQRLALLTDGEGMLSNINNNPLALLQIPFLASACLLSTLLFIKRRKIDIINTHWIVPNGFIFGLLKWMVRIPHMMTVHAADIFMLKRAGMPGRVLCRYATRRSDIVLPVSNYIKDVVFEVSGESFRHDVIPMGVDLARFKPGSAEKKSGFTFLFVGKFSEKKGLKYLLEAAAIMKKNICDFRLIIAGGGSAEPYYRDYSARLGLDRHVKFHGWVNNSNIISLYNESDVLVVPSVFDKKGETEGMPVVILEALACGVPVIASRISGIPDVITEGHNGFLVKPGDAGSLAEKMEQVYKSGVDAYRKNCISTAAAYSTDNLARRYYGHAVELMGR